MVNHLLPHRRKNPLTGDWILVSPHRNRRPWNGAVEKPGTETMPVYDPSCYLCPGNTRASGTVNPTYTKTFVFTNDQPSLLPDTGTGIGESDPLFTEKQESGTSRVICYSPDHNRTMANLSEDEIETVIRTWKDEYESLGAQKYINYVQIFENKGMMMGASNPHPHCQIWANRSIPTIPEKEQSAQSGFLRKQKVSMLLAYEKRERQQNVRIIDDAAGFTILVPFWATWPYETMILPKKPLRSLSDFKPEDIAYLAGTLSRLTRTYDRLFHVSFPYSMGIHQAPTNETSHEEWQFHMHFYPPLLRSATVKKHYVGYEMMAEGQRDITPEDAAQTLRNLYE